MHLKIDITKLKKGLVGSISFDEEVSFPISEVEKTEMRSLSKVRVSGKLIDECEYGYLLTMNIIGSMVLTCALTLEDTLYDFNINVEENITLDEENNENNSNLLDISGIIWENIVLEIPIRVVNENANDKVVKSGDGWDLCLGDEKKVDPRLEVLNELLKEEE